MKTSTTRGLLALLVALVALGACRDSTGPGSPLPAPSGVDVLLVRANAGAIQTLIREDGSIVRDYPELPANATGPSVWAPDGDEFLIRTHYDGRQGALKVSLDGSAVTPVLEGWLRLDGEVFVDGPAGKSIVFIGETLDRRYGIWRVAADGTGLAPLWIAADGTGDPMRWPRLKAISPDGSRILYAQLGDGEWHLNMANLDGSGSVDVSDDLLLNSLGGLVQWLPDGRSALVGRHLPHGLEIHRLAAGSAPKLLFTHDVEAWLWAMSPTGRHVAMYTIVPGEQEVVVMKTDGTGTPTVLEGRGEFLTWSPDGAEVAAVISRETSSLLKLIPADGASPRDLISSGYQPTWRPRQ